MMGYRMGLGGLLHHCAVIFLWSSGIMDCMLFTFVNGVPLNDITIDEQLQ